MTKRSRTLKERMLCSDEEDEAYEPAPADDESSSNNQQSKVPTKSDNNRLSFVVKERKAKRG